ncbi:hypothetical protein TcYC6_0035720 [Trypanosoma cruzi]|nr:hypothetical protein TcYC6_0035720 [Trypanosoma cruzi]
MAWPLTRQSVKPLGSRSSTHTESDYDREGKWPLVVAGCEIPVMTMGHRELRSFLAWISIHGLTLNVAASKQCAAIRTDIAATLHSRIKRRDHLHMTLRTFVIGYGASKLRYGSELQLWGSSGRIQRRMRCRRRMQPWHALSVEFRALSTGIRTSRG